ncbi:MAG: type II toxin-antitoxin system RelE family toxin [Pseudolabrys sp.]
MPSTVTSSSWSVKPCTTPSWRVSRQQRHSVVTPLSSLACKAGGIERMAFPYRQMRYFGFDGTIALCDILAMKEIAFTAVATRQWLGLSVNIRQRIDDKLTVYATNGSGDVKRLKGRGGCRLRAGDWRVIFIEEKTAIVVVAVGNRKDIYE